MKILTIFTEKKLKVGSLLDVVSSTATKGTPVVFKRPTDPLNPVARGVCIGEVEPLETRTSNGNTANVNRFYKRFQVTEEK